MIERTEAEVQKCMDASVDGSAYHRILCGAQPTLPHGSVAHQLWL